MLSSSLLAQAGQSAPATVPNPPQQGVQTNAQTPASVQPNPQNQAEYAAPLKQYTNPYSTLGVWKPYAPHGLPQPVLKNSDRLHSLMKDGKLMLSLSDAVALVLENNFDIAIARYNLDIADMDLLRTKSGGLVRGVNSGLLSGTPGGTSTTSSTSGTTGSGSGGTSTGTGGSTTGSNGVVESTQSSVGSAIDSYDPVLTGTLSIEHMLTPVSNPQYYGTAAYKQNTNTYNFNYAQGWATGTLAQVTYSNQRIENNINPSSPFASTYNPELTASWRATVRQHLLQGWGIDNNRREIITAQNNRKSTDASFKSQVIATVAQIQNIYWDLVNAYEDLKVQQTNLSYAQRTLSDNKKQVEIGTLAPIEVVSAQSTVAAAQQKLILSQTTLQLQQLYIKNAIARNFNDPALTAAEVIPTDTMALSNETAPPTEELVNYALTNRPDLLQGEITLRNDQITNKAARNGLLPTVDLVGFYGSSGIANNYGDVFTGLVNRSGPDKGAYISLSVPIRNRSAQSDQIRAELEYRQGQLSLQQLKNTINLQVRNAAFTLEQDRAAVEAARAARDYNQQSLEAEQKKYSLGASTSILVLQQLNNATAAASNYVTALSSYEKARVALDQVTTQILERNGIYVEDAASGQVNHPPAIPGLQPNTTPSTVTAAPVQK
jgi:outer membrane protein TolC